MLYNNISTPIIRNKNKKIESNEVCDSIMKININAVIKITNGMALNFIPIRYKK